MTQTATLAGLRQQIAPQPLPAVSMNMDTVAGFESMQRAARLFASSSIVPAQYQGEKGLPNCFIAIDMALRMSANPLLVMQNLYIVHGNPAWSAQFLIATFNRCGRFSAIRYEFQGEEGKDNWGCRAVATELATREKLAGPLVTIGLAKKEGWYGKNGSKWQSMPEMMLRYRAAAWFVRTYAPEIAMDLHTVEEEQDKVITIEPAQSSGMTLDDLAASQTPEATPAAEGKEKKTRRKAKTQAAPENAEQPEQQAADMAPDEPEHEPAGVEDEPRPPQQGFTGRYECPREEPDGGHRIVTEADCRACKNSAGCPEYWPHSQGEGAPPDDEEF